MNTMTIGKAAQRAGIGVETIRFYERTGLIEQPLKPISVGFREYPETTVQLLHFIRQAQEIGFSLKEIKELLSIRIDPDADCSEVRRRVRVKLDRLNAKIENMQTMKVALESLIETCPGAGSITQCSIMEALDTRKQPDSDVDPDGPRP